MHATLVPNSYLEIGVRQGRSLALAQCPAIGVDPDPDVTATLPEGARIIRETSDDFFDETASAILKAPPDLVFIDGMHLFENVLRDFMNVEKIAGPHTMVVIDDVSPNLPEQANRTRQTRVWTGDVWKIADCLRKHRPDLQLTLVDAAPTGLLLIAGLDPGNRTLWRQYNPIVRQYAAEAPPPAAVIAREGALSPAGGKFEQVLQLYRNAKAAERSFATCSPALRSLRETPGRPSLRLSVIVISFNMAREVPRTLFTLSPQLQRGLVAEDYEIILVDNGSTKPFDDAACAAIAPNIRIFNHDAKSISPVGAINRGLAEARGENVCVMIDGARMASPGLLICALDALQLSPEAVVGTLAFHLGREVQMKSVTTGYNQQVEDELLASAPRQEDGYRLFDISVLAGSSADGWFRLPLETNALFMSKRNWSALGGFEPGFQSAGGGLANHDMWLRAATAPGSQVILLAGEGTFHQFHGGVAANSSTPRFEEFHAEYKAIRGCAYERPTVPFRTFGAFQPVHYASLDASLRAMRHGAPVVAIKRD